MTQEKQAPEKLGPPTPAEVDALASEMLKERGEISVIEEKAKKDKKPHEDRLKELRERATTLVRQFGSSHREKSKLLHGIVYEIMGTFGSSMSIDAAAVEVFRLALVKAKQARLVRKVFEKTVRWTLATGWAEVVRGTKLAPKLLAAYARCQVPVDLTPVITPREKDPKPKVETAEAGALK